MRLRLVRNAVAGEQKWACCNGTKPSCLRCTERRLSCVYANDIDHRGSAPRSLVSLLQNRIKLLEDVLQRHSIDIEASIAQIQGGESQSEEPRQETCNSSTSQDLNSGQDLQKPELQGALYSEQPGSGLHPVGEDQMRFFGPASGRLDLQPSQAAVDGAAADSTHADDRSDQPQSKRVNNPSQERFNAYSQSLAAEALRDLSPELVEHLIDLYFEWEQPWFQVVDEELFRASRMQNGRYYSPVLLCCIIAVASRYSDRLEVRSDPQDANTAGLAFIEHAEALIHFDLKWPSITTVQSLAIMAIFYVASQVVSGSL
ncbi:hypothetical protein PFICI_04311 [Pestalotiopsis fici W106-1]|uniref:Xylanolytic transcriptional activator regulatory domain-containing protein n=1 Tax=Pestalotiopsis fici (strain W106-1 / CGMCC3.15140) TaxID=1229662 RepID=W3X8R5_PESFW|nr:uncharacterized protein PFICI_04311 [Pestalotiopsis fici W106-1]ETS82435.1 hypothetical protein PFICI_04311 [Pestalotiopsis fici W106-1]